MKVVDSIIKEPLGGAHRNPSETISNVKEILTSTLKELVSIKGTDLLKKRRKKYLDFS